MGCSPVYGPQSHTPRPWAPFCAQTANGWRSSGDINPIFGNVIGQNLGSLIGRGSLAGPGGWNYPDSLEVGVFKHNKTLPPNEARAHFSLWCITSSPLYLAFDVRNITAEHNEDALAVVSNKDAISVNQVRIMLLELLLELELELLVMMQVVLVMMLVLVVLVVLAVLLPPPLTCCSSSLTARRGRALRATCSTSRRTRRRSPSATAATAR